MSIFSGITQVHRTILIKTKYTCRFCIPNVELILIRLHKHLSVSRGARCSSVVRAFAHGAMGRRIDY